MNKKEP